METSIIVHPTVEDTTKSLRSLVAEINRWLTIEGTLELTIQEAVAQCGQELKDLRSIILRNAGNDGTHGESLLASLLVQPSASGPENCSPEYRLATRPSTESATLFRSIGLLCAPDRNIGLDEKIQQKLTSILSKAAEANDLGDTVTLQSLKERAKVVLTGAGVGTTTYESLDSLKGRVASLREVLTHLRHSVTSRNAFGVRIFDFFDESSESFAIEALQQNILENINKLVASQISKESPALDTQLPEEVLDSDNALSIIPSPTVESGSIIPMSITAQRDVLSTELEGAIKKAASWAQFLKHRDTSCSELILRDASGVSQQGFRLSWHVFDRIEDRPNDLPDDFSLFQIEREIGGQGLLIQGAFKELHRYGTLGEEENYPKESHRSIPTSIMFWMNPRGEVRLLEEDQNQSSLNGIRVFLNSLEDIQTCASPLVTYWNEFSERRYHRSAIPITVGEPAKNGIELDEADKALLSIVRSLILLKAPKIVERKVTKELWLCGKFHPDDDPIVEFYSRDISMGEGVQVPFAARDDRDKEVPEFGYTFISEDEEYVDHYKRLLRGRKCTFSGSLEIQGKSVPCRCTIEGPPLFEYLSVEPMALSTNPKEVNWEISFENISLSSEDLTTEGAEDSRTILKALAEVIPTGFTTSKITFYNTSSVRLRGESVEYYPGILMKPEEPLP